MTELEQWRNEIRALDAQIKPLFLQRFALAQAIGRYKSKHGLPVYDPEREAQNRQALSADVNQIEKKAYEEFLQAVMTICRKAQES